ncbi:MAG: PLP-dependent aminotransferase family protein [Coriobacteriia bacterium]|nr:PLP-dependent aminotransferase family protein [Coriobacteriia bacterium]
MKFAKRAASLDSTFMNEILKAAANPDLISFAGGLPNPELFPVEEIRAATDKLLSTDGKNALQYNISEGYPALREFIAARYYPGEDLSIDNILITSGSQQGLDMLGRLFIDPGDGILFERPGYLGALQAFDLSEPRYLEVPVSSEGVDVEVAASILQSHGPIPLFYGDPNFQNPTGASYSLETRLALARVLENYDTIFIEDNPYVELRFAGTQAPSMKSLLGDKVIALGSFSKVFAPAMRMGWVAGPVEIIKALGAIKGATDMHTNYLTQRILYQYLCDNDFDAHIKRTVEVYKAKSELMMKCMQEELPSDVSFVRPEGGMFTWVTLPEDIKSTELLKVCRERGMYYIPGIPFYASSPDEHTCRLNFSNSTDENIVKGIQIMGQAIKDYRN